jgi:hypothetical protein
MDSLFDDAFRGFGLSAFDNRQMRYPVLPLMIAWNQFCDLAARAPLSRLYSAGQKRDQRFSLGGGSAEPGGSDLSLAGSGFLAGGSCRPAITSLMGFNLAMGAPYRVSAPSKEAPDHVEGGKGNRAKRRPVCR